jgi:hypothetical protein
MDDIDSIPDDVPPGDAFEQQRPAGDPPEPWPTDVGDSAPLESDPSDWQEQHEVVEGPDPDEER